MSKKTKKDKPTLTTDARPALERALDVVKSMMKRKDLSWSEKDNCKTAFELTTLALYNIQPDTWYHVYNRQNRIVAEFGVSPTNKGNFGYKAYTFRTDGETDCDLGWVECGDKTALEAASSAIENIRSYLPGKFNHPALATFTLKAQKD